MFPRPWRESSPAAHGGKAQGGKVHEGPSAVGGTTHTGAGQVGEDLFLRQKEQQRQCVMD